jgi:hypothetical protein
MRRLQLVWALLTLNVLSFVVVTPLVLPIPSVVGKLITQGSMILMLLAALALNPRGYIRPNAYLTILTVLAVTALPVSLGSDFWAGSTYRSVRLIVFVATLWLLTPWWGARPDMPLLRVHLRTLTAVLATVVAGALVSPGRAFAFDNRLSGVVWPIPPTQVAHYAAILVGCTCVLWFCRLVSSRRALGIGVAGGGILLLTHTRTALAAMLVGLILAGMSLLLTRSRVRAAFAWTAATALVAALIFAPVITSWLARGQSASEATQLTGRTLVWHDLLAAPRSNVHVLLGYGLSNKSFHGLSIDSSWLALYQDSGLLGGVLVVALMLALILGVIFTARGPYRAIALFLIAYDLTASFAEVGLGDASPYLLDLAVAAALLWRAPRRGST